MLNPLHMAFSAAGRVFEAIVPRPRAQLGPDPASEPATPAAPPVTDRQRRAADRDTVSTWVRDHQRAERVAAAAADRGADG